MKTLFSTGTSRLPPPEARNRIRHPPGTHLESCAFCTKTTPCFCILYPLEKNCNAYLFRTDVCADMFKRYSTGIIDSRLRLYPDVFLSLKSPVPPFEEQQRIVSFLNTECAKIDAVIKQTRASIEEYKILKQSIITEAVTKGIRSNRPMKDSGIEWIGDIPIDWDCVTVGRISTVVRGSSPRPAGDPRYFNGSYIPWITVSEVTNGYGKYILSTTSFLTEEGANRSRIIGKGTLLLSNSGATLGVPRISMIKGCINDGSLAFYNLQVKKDYLYYIFASRTIELRKQMQGYGQPNLNTTIVKEMYIPLPPDEEQIEIASYLDVKLAMIDDLLKQKEVLLIELETYKKSLIYEYVTGKKEVINDHNHSESP